MARQFGHRGKPKKKLNRYNPNHPDYNAVHAPWSLPNFVPVVSAVRFLFPVGIFRRALRY